MDQETFYAENEARRESAEFELGDDWTDADGTRYELTWVEATGEVYLMLEPEAEILSDPFGDFLDMGVDVNDETVVIIGKIASHDHLEVVLDGWQDAMLTENSLAWLAEKFPQN